MEIKLSLGTSSIKDINFVTYTPVRRFAAGNDRFVGRGELWGGCRQERQGVNVGGWNGPLRSLTPDTTPHKQRTLTGLRASNAEIFI